MERVVILRPMMRLFAMQVCAVSDATDEEILRVCNLQNPSGTTNGWCEVIRHVEKHHEDNFQAFSKNCEPVTCEDDPNRTHFIIGC